MDMKIRSPGVTGKGHRQLSVMHPVYCSTDTFFDISIESHIFGENCEYMNIFWEGIIILGQTHGAVD